MAITGGSDFNQDAADARYLKLDTTNDPLTGNLDVSKADPEYRLTDTGDSEYARWTRSDTSSVMQLFNRVEKPGATGYALTFDGNGDYAQAASGINYASTESHTLEAWIYPTAVPSQYGWVINNGSAGNLGTSLIVRSQDGGITFKISFFYQGGNGVTTATTNLSLNTWQHIAAVYDQSTNKVTFYLNGTADGESGTLGSWSGGTTAVKLGMFDSNHYFTGRIDEPRIYNAALSAATILAKYNSGNGTYGTSGDANIVYGWHLDENTGTTAASFATANTLTLNGNATWADGKVSAPATTIEVSGIKIEDGVAGLEGGIITLGDDQSSVRIEGNAITFNEDGDDTDIRFESDSDANLLFLDGGNNNIGVGTATPTGGKLHIVPDSTTKTAIFVNAPSGYASAAHLLDLQINGTRKIGVDWQGYLTSPTHTIRFKRNDSTTAYLELKSEGPNGFGAINMSGTDVLSRSSTGVDYGDIAGALNANFRGAAINFFNDSQLINYGTTNNQFRWNNFGGSYDNAFWVGTDDFVANTTDMVRITTNATTKRNLILKKIASQSVDVVVVLPSDQTVAAFAIDQNYKLQWGDGAGGTVDTQLGRSAADELNTPDSLVVGRAFSSGVVTLTDAATIATNAALGNHFRVTLGDNRTLGNPTNAKDGQKLTWEIIQDGTGGRTLALDTKFAFGTDITGVTLSTTAGKRDFLAAIYNATADKFYVVAFTKGY